MTSEASLLEVYADTDRTGSNPFETVSGVDLARMLVASAAHRDRTSAVRRVEGARRLQAWAASLEQQAMIDTAGASERVVVHEIDGRAVAVKDEAVAELALVTRQSELDVRRQLQAARTINAALPQVQQALSEGRIDASKAMLIAATADRLPAGNAPELEQRLLAAAEVETVRELRSSAEQAVRKIDPTGAAERAARAARKRAVWTNPDTDGNAILSARLSAADAHAVYRSITDAVRARREQTDAAHEAAGLERPTTGMLCAEELVARLLGTPVEAADSCIGAADSCIGAGGIAGGGSVVSSAARSIRTLAVELQVKVDLRTLAGLQHEPVEIDGSISADVAELRRWLNEVPDLHFRRLITDPDTQAVLDCGRSTYVPSAALRRFLVARDGRCVWEGCEEPAVTCDIDHAVPWDQGGRTDRDNLNAYCRRHHLLKTFAGYHMVRGADGEWLLVTPTGEIRALSRSDCRALDGDPSGSG